MFDSIFLRNGRVQQTGDLSVIHAESRLLAEVERSMEQA
jgi:hypothetical protein